MTKYHDPAPAKISLSEWDKLYSQIPPEMLRRYKYIRELPKFARAYVSPISTHSADGDKRLRVLKYDNSLAGLRLWSFLLTEEERLAGWRAAGYKLFGAMKDLGTVPVMVFSTGKGVAFYPDGAWWIPCMMEMSDELFKIADDQGVGDDACPVRAALGAFISKQHFPLPDLCIAGVGSCCDDFSAIMQRIAGLGHKFLWWELPYRKDPKPWYRAGKFINRHGQPPAPASLLSFVIGQLKRVKQGIEDEIGSRITDAMLRQGIRKANRLRRVISRLRNLAYGVMPVPAAALEMLICEAIALHFCSDAQESIRVLADFLRTVEMRVKKKQGILPGNPFRLTWVNPVADMRMMNLVEELGGRIAGTEYLFSHALELIPEDMPPLDALAQMVLADPMIGSAEQRAERVIAEARKYRSEGVVISRIPGASHCASEGQVIADIVRRKLGLPVLEITVPSLIDASLPALKNRLQAFFEILAHRRENTDSTNPDGFSEREPGMGKHR